MFDGSLKPYSFLAADTDWFRFVPPTGGNLLVEAAGLVATNDTKALKSHDKSLDRDAPPFFEYGERSERHAAAFTAKVLQQCITGSEKCSSEVVRLLLDTTRVVRRFWRSKASVQT